MAQVVFSSWGRKIVDNRQGGEADLASLKLKLAENYLDEGKVGAFMGWDGIVLMDRETDVVAMAAEYMKRVQEKYCCAKCTPGKKGTRVLQDTLARIVAGHGEERDLEIIEELAALLETCKCTLCMTSAVPVFDAVKHFRQDFLDYIARQAQAETGQVLPGKAHRALHGPLPGAYRHSRLYRRDQGVPLRRIPRRDPSQHADPGGLRPGLPASLREGLPAGAGRRADQHHGPEARRLRPRVAASQAAADDSQAA